MVSQSLAGGPHTHSSLKCHISFNKTPLHWLMDWLIDSVTSTSTCSNYMHSFVLHSGHKEEGGIFKQTWIMSPSLDLKTADVQIELSWGLCCTGLDWTVFEDEMQNTSHLFLREPAGEPRTEQPCFQLHTNTRILQTHIYKNPANTQIQEYRTAARHWDSFVHCPD